MAPGITEGRSPPPEIAPSKTFSCDLQVRKHGIRIIWQMTPFDFDYAILFWLKN
jgi:hypothetical protein